MADPTSIASAQTAQAAPDWAGLLAGVPEVVTAVTAVVGVVLALRGLNRWRTEMIGRRRAELAEDVLTDFYEACQIMTDARNMGGWSSEGATRKAGEGETAGETDLLNSYFRTSERLFAKAEFFAKMRSRKYRAMAVFGASVAEHYDAFDKIHAEVNAAVHMLVITVGDGNDGSLPQNRKDWKATIGWCLPKDDPVKPRLDAVIEKVEAFCAPAIQESARKSTSEPR